MVGPLNESLDGLNMSLTGADRTADAALYILAQGKFYTLFSLLFGAGFMIMMMRAQQAGRAFFRVYLRRIFVLALIGLAHGLFVWSGDILFSYACFGLLLLLCFSNTPTSRLPKWGLFFYFVPVIIVFGFNLFAEGAKFDATAEAQFTRELANVRSDMQTMAEDQREAYGSGTYSDAITQAYGDLRMLWGMWIYMGWQLLGMFLLGAWFARSGAFANPENYKRLYFRLRWIGFPIGLAMMLWSYKMVPSNDMSEMGLRIGVANVLLMTGSLLMSLGYLALIVRGLQSRLWSRMLAVLAPAGRMALTNYLMQSVIGVFIFYNWGLGYYDQLGRAWQVVYVIVLFGAQIVFSHWWLARFRFGPAEWVWRTLTYLRIP